MKNLWVFLIIALMVTGCGKIKEIGSREPTANDCKKVLENVFKECFEGKEILQVLSVEKIQTYEKIDNGTPVCYVVARLKVKYLTNIDTSLNGLHAGMTIKRTLHIIAQEYPPDLPEGQKGEVKQIVFKVRFEKTNKGWLASDGNLY